MRFELAFVGFFVFVFSNIGVHAKADNDAAAIGEHTFEANGLKLWYKVSGKGPLCIMPTPAWGPSSDLYFLSLQTMEKKFTMVYLDSRGTGRSEAPATTKENTWELLSSDIDALRHHLGQDQIWLMGHSEGGIEVLHYTCAHPERVVGMILLNTAAIWEVEHKVDVFNRMMMRENEPWFDDAFNALANARSSDEQFQKDMMVAMPLYWSDPKKAEPFADVFAATTFRAAASEGQGDSGRYPFDLRDELGKLSTPALIVVGDDDYICSPIAASRLHLALKNSKLLLIEDSGHFPWMEQKETFDKYAIEYLDSVMLQAANRAEFPYLDLIK